VKVVKVVKIFLVWEGDFGGGEKMVILGF